MVDYASGMSYATVKGAGTLIRQGLHVICAAPCVRMPFAEALRGLHGWCGTMLAGARSVGLGPLCIQLIFWCWTQPTPACPVFTLQQHQQQHITIKQPGRVCSRLQICMCDLQSRMRGRDTLALWTFFTLRCHLHMRILLLLLLHGAHTRGHPLYIHVHMWLALTLACAVF